MWPLAWKLTRGRRPITCSALPPKYLGHKDKQKDRCAYDENDSTPNEEVGYNEEEMKWVLTYDFAIGFAIKLGAIKDNDLLTRWIIVDYHEKRNADNKYLKHG